MRHGCKENLMSRTSSRILITWLGCAFLAAVSARSSWAAAPNGPTSSSSHHIRTVFIILMENHNWTGDSPNMNIKGNPQAPYINNTLVPIASHAESYYNPPGLHPSLPNYLWLEAGTNFGILNDGLPSQNSQSTTQHLVTLLKNAGISWKAYEENIDGTDCPLINEGPVDPNGSQLYAPKHDAFVYFDDVTDNQNPNSAYCIAHVRPYTELAADLQNNNLASYNFITPNLCDDMHDSCTGGNIPDGDKWLSQNVPAILNSTAYQKSGALFITWDEADEGDGPIGMIVLSPFAKGGGYSSQIHYTHGSTLRTMQEIFGVGPFLGDAAKETDLKDLFQVFP
jgi:phosphatidylinositol-3-phosphatase